MSRKSISLIDTITKSHIQGMSQMFESQSKVRKPLFVTFILIHFQFYKVSAFINFIGSELREFV